MQRGLEQSVHLLVFDELFAGGPFLRKNNLVSALDPVSPISLAPDLNDRIVGDHIKGDSVHVSRKARARLEVVPPPDVLRARLDLHGFRKIDLLPRRQRIVTADEQQRQQKNSFQSIT